MIVILIYMYIVFFANLFLLNDSLLISRDNSCMITLFQSGIVIL